MSAGPLTTAPAAAGRPLVEIPVSGVPERFTVTLKGVPYILRLTFSDGEEGGWSLDVHAADEAPVVCGIPLVMGLSLLDGYEYLGIGGLGSQLWLMSGDGSDEPPGFENLSDYRLILIEGQ